MPILKERLWTMHNLKAIRQLLHESQTFAISGHINPDGDSIGALLSLGLGLESIGKKVFMLCCEPLPKRYKTLPGAMNLVASVDRSIDVAIAVDCGSKKMISPVSHIFDDADLTIEIDHHRSRTPFGDLSYVDPEASSAGELVYEILVDMKIPITEAIAQNILTSILVETNSFRLPGIRSRTFEICGELLKSGVDFFHLAETVYWVTSKETALLCGICMSRLNFSKDNKIAWSILTRKNLEKIGAADTDADPITENIRAIQCVKIAILFREKNKSQLRVSLRSKAGIDVSIIAEKFNGGGHTSASGCTIPNTQKKIDELLNFAENICKKYYSRLSKDNLNSNFNIDPQFNNNTNDITRSPAVILFETMIAGKKPDTSIYQEEISDRIKYRKSLPQKVAF